MTEKSKKDDEFLILGTEVAMSIINIQTRKLTLRKNLFSRMMDEKGLVLAASIILLELNNLLQAHKETFTQFIWKRRVQTKKDLRVLFQTGFELGLYLIFLPRSGIIGRFGDLIAESNIETIQAFERTNSMQICNEAIDTGICELEDIPGVFKQVILLQPPVSNNTAITISSSRLEFKVIEKKISDEWYCLAATSGPWAIKLFSKSLIKSICDQTASSLKAVEKNAVEYEYSYLHMIARLFDLVHPSHQLQAAILAYPLYSTHILKRRIQALGYTLSSNNDDSTFFDHKAASELIKQLQEKTDKDMKCYFEIIVPYKANWRAG